MKNLILMFLMINIYMFQAMGAEKDTLTVKGNFYQDGELISIYIKNGKIAEINHLSQEKDNHKMFVAPGLIDIQINGYMGVDFSDQDLTIEHIRKATKALWKSGVTTFLPTVITNDQKRLKRSLTILANALNDDEVGMSIPGFHLEGPYISPIQGFRGAHLEKYIRKPDWDEFSELQSVAHNGIRLITLAPETDGAIPFIKKCVEKGVIVSLGHHNGSGGIIKQAVDAGASLSTHLGNGCANMINRWDNPLWPQLAEDRLSASIISDGFHLPKEEVKCFYRMKGVERTILVSDALDLAGLPPGEYTHGEQHVVLTSDVVKLPNENVLAGAASLITADVTNIIKFTDCSMGDAIQMASSNPAKLLGLTDIGDIKVGKRADLILFTIEDGKIVIQKTIVAGKIVYSK